MDCSPPGSSVHGDSLGKNTGVGCQFLLQGIFLQGNEPESPALQADSSSSESPGKPLALIDMYFISTEEPGRPQSMGSQELDMT